MKDDEVVKHNHFPFIRVSLVIYMFYQSLPVGRTRDIAPSLVYAYLSCLSVVGRIAMSIRYLTAKLAQQVKLDRAGSSSNELIISVDR